MLIYILLGTVILYSAYIAYAFQLERSRSVKREQELLAAVLARNIDQYIGAIDALRKLPKEKLAEMKLENELAQAAVKLEAQGIPVR
ncbi:MAG: hypothetical protein ABIH23_05100 [bacterium]